MHGTKLRSCVLVLSHWQVAIYSHSISIALDSWRPSHVCKLKGLVPRLTLALFCRQNMSGQTALHLAARIGHAKCLRTLLEHGADISIMVSIEYIPVSQYEFQATSIKLHICLALIYCTVLLDTFVLHLLYICMSLYHCTVSPGQRWTHSIQHCLST